MVRVQGRRKWRVQQCLTRVCWWHFYLQISQPQPSIVEWMIIALPAVGSSPSHVAPIVEKPPWWRSKDFHRSVPCFVPFMLWSQCFIQRINQVIFSPLANADSLRRRDVCIHLFDVRGLYHYGRKNPCCRKGQLNYRCQPLQGQQTITNQ